MDRSVTQALVICATCEAAIIGRPVFRAAVPFCCAGCVAGGPCICSYDVEPVEPGTPAAAGAAAIHSAVRHCLDVRAMVDASDTAMALVPDRARTRILASE